MRVYERERDKKERASDRPAWRCQLFATQRTYPHNFLAAAAHKRHEVLLQKRLIVDERLDYKTHSGDSSVSNA